MLRVPLSAARKKVYMSVCEQGVMIVIWQRREGAATAVASLPPLPHSTPLPSLIAFTKLMCMTQTSATAAFSSCPETPESWLSAPGRPVRVPGAHPAHSSLRVNGPFRTPARAGAGSIRTRPPEVTMLPMGPCRGHKEQCRWRSCVVAALSRHPGWRRAPPLGHQ